MSARAAVVNVLAIGLAIGLLTVGHPLDRGRAAAAPAIERNCPSGQIWDPNQGACIKKKQARKLSPEEKYYQAIDHLEGKGRGASPTRAVELLGQACAGSHGTSCTLLGFLYVNGRGTAADPRRALTSYKRACELGDLDGCVGAADVYGRGLLGAVDHAAALPLLAKACTAGSGKACYQLAGKYADALGVDKDDAKATALYQQAFARFSTECPKIGPSCHLLGMMYLEAKGVANDNQKALDAWRAGCDAGSGDACFQLGQAHREGWVVAQSEAEALRLYDRACRQYDNAAACHDAGAIIALGPESGWDAEKLTYYGQRSCELDKRQCELLAHLLTTKKGGRLDQVESTRWYQVACDSGNALACSVTAYRLTDGDGFPSKDPVGAVKLWERACEGNNPDGCQQAGVRHYEGTVVTKDLARAFELFHLGCLRGNGQSCHYAGEQVALGEDGTNKPDPERGAMYYDEGCNHGRFQTCSALGDLYTGGKLPRDVAKALTAYQRGCDGVSEGVSSYSCEQIGTLRYSGDGVDKDVKLALAAFSRACRHGAGRTCYWLDSMAREAALDGDAKAAVITTLDEACGDSEKRVEDACVALGNVLGWGGYSGNKNGRRAFALFDESCKHGFQASCASLAAAYAAGVGVVADAEKAKQLYRELCDNDNAAACSQLGTQLRKEKKLTEAAALYRRACDEGDSGGCNQIGFAHYTAQGVRWDVAEAAKAYQRSCELGEPVGCSNVAELHQYGVVLAKDLTKAFELYQKACTPTVDIGCGRVGYFVERGLGGATKDLERAEIAYKRSCNAEYASPEACRWLSEFYRATGKGTAPQIAALAQKAFDSAKEYSAENPFYQYVLGTFYLDGVGTMADPTKAAAQFDGACEGYDPIGCLEAGRMYLGDRGLPADKVRAAAHFDRACAANVQESCELAAKARGVPLGGDKVPLTAKKGGCACQVGDDGGGAAAGWLVLVGAIGGVVLRRRRGR